MVECDTRGLVPPQVCESRAISSRRHANNGTIVNVSSACCNVLLHKGAITEVILVYAMEYCMEMPIFF